MTTTLSDCIRLLTEALRDAGIDTPERDARLLVAAAAGQDPAWLISHGEASVPADTLSRIAQYRQERLDRRPVSRILGTRAFWRHSFLITGATLDPRPDTETLIEAALDLIAEKDLAKAPLHILDLGTGTGCILLSLLAELPQATGVATDVSPEALATARANAAVLNLSGRAHFLLSDWFDQILGTFDVIVSNPPYIRSSEIANLAPEVARHDPPTALDGGPDALDAYRRIAGGLAPHLKDGTLVLLEVGLGQANAVVEIMRERCKPLSSRNVLERQDLAGIVRAVGWRP